MTGRIKKEMSEWKVHKTINLGDILTMTGMLTAVAAAFFAVWFGLKEDIEDNQRRLGLVEYQVAIQKEQYSRDRREMNDRFDRIESLLQQVYYQLERNNNYEKRQ